MWGTLSDDAYRRMVARAASAAREASDRLVRDRGDAAVVTVSGCPDAAVRSRPSTGRPRTRPWSGHQILAGFAGTGSVAIVWVACALLLPQASTPSGWAGDAGTALAVLGLSWIVPLAMLVATAAGAFDKLPLAEAARAAADGSVVGVGSLGIYVATCVPEVDGELMPTGGYVGWARLVPFGDIGKVVAGGGSLGVLDHGGATLASVGSLGPGAEAVLSALAGAGVPARQVPVAA